MKTCVLLACLCAGIISHAFAQSDESSSAPLSSNASSASKMAAVPINYYTGIPSISVPLYAYSHKSGLSLNVSLSYFAGGMRVNEPATTAGFGWNLNAGGVITRTLRGMPDDLNANGFMYSGALPADYRPNATKYYYDSIDAEQDVFQFSFNGRSGKFYIGKNKQIVVVPTSKLRVSYVTSGGANTPIASFTLINEGGTKYVFADRETQTVSDYISGYSGSTYTSAWYLSQIICPFGGDTIKFTYNSVSEFVYADVDGTYNYTGYVLGGVLKKTTALVMDATNIVKKIASISFPDKKTITFLYDKKLKYDGHDSVLNRINISDSVLRFGYLFNWNTAGRNYLNGIDYYTSRATRNLYKFEYTSSLFPSWGSGSISNQRDHWGFFNGQTGNGTNQIPAVSGVYTGGANRSPATAVVQGSLSSVTDPTGGKTYYNFEPNDLVQYTTSNQNVTANALSSSTSNNATFNQVFSSQNSITMTFDNSVSRTGTSPFSSQCSMTCKITSIDGLTTYATYNVNLNQIFYVGSAGWTFNVPNGNYKLTTSISNCTSSLGSAYVVFSWQNQSIAGTGAITGGMRIKQITHYDPYTKASDTLATYRYVAAGGGSSGFLTTTPKYDYPYSETVINGGTTVTNYTAISSEPVNTLDYTQGSPVGYSRVEVINGSLTHSIGKEVYEFTTLADANSSSVIPSFPYAPVSQRDWAMGLPKRILVYDSAGTLIKATNNTYSIVTTSDSTSNFQSLKLGKTSRTYNGNPITPSTPKTDYFTGAYYYPEAGRADITLTIDSVYHPDGSIQVSQKSFQYDASYNVTKITSPFDKSRGLTSEQRIYYPYNYTLGGSIGKLRDSNIIALPVSTENWIVGDANPRANNISITDFQTLLSGQVRPSIQYGLQSNAPVALSAFNPASLVRNTSVIKETLRYQTYDSDNNLLQTYNPLTSTYSSVIMDYDNQFAVAKVSNAAVNDIAYTSFESDGSGNWTIGSVTRDYSDRATGKASYNLSNGSVVKTGLSSSKSYVVSAWCKSGSIVQFNGQYIQIYSQHSDGWGFYMMTLSGITSVTVSGSGLIDELRLYPKEANMATFTYEPMVGITSTNDDNNTLGYTIYDELNRPKLLLDQNKNILKKYEYGAPYTLITNQPNWQLQSFSCTGTQQKRNEKDVNRFSPSFDSTRTIYITDCATCPPTCNLSDPSKKVVGCTCETGQRWNISCVYKKINGTTWKYVCTYKYCWSDATISSASYTENNDYPCPIGAPACAQ